ncbi:class I SAM-dependent methyltransferase [Sandaracinobacter sp. RS1-74]|uniref:DUF938 domain-containing protein n=1 Tax=Sandaracinobacteroides sayramensis TaxID=2913411 RepID=UPI001EDB2797|nr:DUF938 domain-containing protein [Sandaracinobacteroides sayramensis]MCG2840493.1 class I SAM-dependent methyltransferase [Sandaracinobacteroides sayramensis]
MREARLSSPAARRNREPILQLLRDSFPAEGLVLEVASGSGEHIVHFARALPGLYWQPSDPSAEARASIRAHVADSGLSNILPPMELDATAPLRWPIERADAALCINMLHISPWTATLGLFEGAARVLPAGARLLIYGPYLEEGVETAASNLAFDASLKARDPEWGLRWRHEVEGAGLAHGLRPVARHALPANNLALLFQRTG